MTKTVYQHGERAVEKRARYLDRTTDLERREAEALAWRETGCSHAGIAKEIDATEGTVADYMARVTAQYGVHVTLTKLPDERDDLEAIDAETVSGWPDHYRTWWREAAEEHPDRVPDSIDIDRVVR